MKTVADLFAMQWLSASPQTLWSDLIAAPLYEEAQWVEQLILYARNNDQDASRINDQARTLSRQMRQQTQLRLSSDRLLNEYPLDTPEGVQLMSLAEALLRIPDPPSRDTFLACTLAAGNWHTYLGWRAHRGFGANVLGNAVAGALASANWVANISTGAWRHTLQQRIAIPALRALFIAMTQHMGRQFILGQSLPQALNKAEAVIAKGGSYSFDMLGEAALTAEDAADYFRRYRDAIAAVSRYRHRAYPLTVSIKLSALFPRYEPLQQVRVMNEMYPTVLQLLRFAKQQGVAVTIDAEEADRLELSLLLFEKLYRDPQLQGWGGLGLAVQAYDKRALLVLAWLAALSHEQKIPVRLVKGAYWDSEIKHAQQLGLSHYPVYTSKAATDIAYLACARFLLTPDIQQRLSAQFATHNAHTVSAIEVMAGHGAKFEFQRLHGMGAELYHSVNARQHFPLRIYAPVGSNEQLLPYLVRRLLENGANSSFVHCMADPSYSIDKLCRDPVAVYREQEARKAAPSPEREKPHEAASLRLPSEIYAPARRNSAGINLQWQVEREQLLTQLAPLTKGSDAQATGLINGCALAGKSMVSVAPFDTERVIGSVAYNTCDDFAAAIIAAKAGLAQWSQIPVAARCEQIEKLGASIEAHRAELIALCQLEVGKTLQDAIDEIREAADFCYYYSAQLRGQSSSMAMGDYQYHFRPRGVICCISPWNFPLAIFVGQIVAALVSGNTVIAKPAPQTCLVAHRCVQLWFDAGLPTYALQLVLGDASVVGKHLLDERISGVVFTGSTASAKQIQRQLALRTDSPLFIAETGGINAMVVDSTALVEQVVKDVIRSAFASAGQRCSALRLLLVQDEILPAVKTMLIGAMKVLNVGSPLQLVTDVGPVIDFAAYQRLRDYLETQKEWICCQSLLPEYQSNGYFIPPSLVGVNDIADLTAEHFGPVLHIAGYSRDNLPQVIAQLNAKGYGLTLGIHSRNTHSALAIAEQVHVGNCYINRDQVGAVVGVQPFGGLGLSGTGPKAGGPHYLRRFQQMRRVTV
uniref:bifunctional proline dehydrogenase/L-glutamate gamma-semialdehyde dehydrogenase PutA n=1 Tax=Thaumasiovibrio occultus TaxID=1891184 RepID=UPI000B34D717|nr:bifunctional proline dehydrogenase/L-glutamate gamma-semialdehyde dehydrogenase PutA [Thaumasiovibrio occultus]